MQAFRADFVVKSVALYGMGCYDGKAGSSPSMKILNVDPNLPSSSI